MALIEVNDLSKTFKVVKQKEGIKGAVQNLFSKEYNFVTAVDGISMEVEQGEIVGYLGPNGAGKSTTIKMLTGILQPSSGEIRIDGLVPYVERKKIAKSIGVVFGQRTQLWWALPVCESFKVLKEIYQVSDEDYKKKIELYNGLLDFEELYLKPVRQLSLGQRTLCDLLAAFLHNPKIVFLDEPTIGLDVSIKHKMRQLIKDLNSIQNTTVLLTSHDLGDVEALCERVVVINQGKKIFDDKYSVLKELHGINKYVNAKIKDENINANKEALKKVCLENKLQLEMLEDDSVNIYYDSKKMSVLRLLEMIGNKFEEDSVGFGEIDIETIVRKIYEGE